MPCSYVIDRLSHLYERTTFMLLLHLRMLAPSSCVCLRPIPSCRRQISTWMRNGQSILTHAFGAV
jgi:hypothetical protein